MSAGPKTPLVSPKPNEDANKRFPESSAATERRREIRYLTNDAVEVRQLDGGGGLPMAGTIVDISRSGMRVEIPSPIAKGMWVEVILGDRTIIFAEARHCRRLSKQYQVGMAIEAVCSGRNESVDHIAESRLSLYRAGGGLPAQEAIRIANHLFACSECQTRLASANGRDEVKEEATGRE